MKHILLLALLSAIVTTVYAQTRKEAILTKEISPVRSSASPYQIKGIIPGFELAITSFQVKKLPDVAINGEMRHKLQIDCTIRNGGSVPIQAIKVSLGGKISYSAQYDTGIDACGASLSGLTSITLNPGESRSTTYYCTVRYDASQHAYYNLLVTAVGMSETNLQNNAAQATIPY